MGNQARGIDDDQFVNLGAHCVIADARDNRFASPALAARTGIANSDFLTTPNPSIISNL
jgi:hypothetical protein